jgi:hypothetical protein
MIHDTGHELYQQGFPNSASHLMMPVVKGGGSDQTLHQVNDGTTAVSLPGNLQGDHCNGSAGEIFCGYWYETGWEDTDSNQYPDPEDWGPEHLRDDTFISCMSWE